MEEALNVAARAKTTPRDAAYTAWDVIVIGAGPAGAVAARQFARAGLCTLLIDAKHFPREKVCGGYLNRRALDVLHHTNLLTSVATSVESEVDELDLICGKQRARFALPTGQVVCRTSFDASLVDAAQSSGVSVLLGAHATVEPLTQLGQRTVTLICNGKRESITAKVVVCADGVARTSVRHLPEFAQSTAPDSRVGIGAVVADDSEAHPYRRITMVVSRRGYVGISRIDRHQLNVAGAIEPALLSCASPAEVAAAILNAVNVAVPIRMTDATWRGTPPLTSRPKRVAADRVLLIGDAGGYVEPFTGEGMATALETAVAVAPFVLLAMKSWVPTIAVCWDSLHRQIVRDRQHTCRRLAWILRRPWATIVTMRTCRALPVLAARWISKTSQPISLNSQSISNLI
jgi:flavin-dependent dehydrogenase